MARQCQPGLPPGAQRHHVSHPLAGRVGRGAVPHTSPLWPRGWPARHRTALTNVASPVASAPEGFHLRLLALAHRVAYDAFLTFLRDDGWAIASHIALSTLMSLFPFVIFLTAFTSFLYGSEELAEKAAEI